MKSHFWKYQCLLDSLSHKDVRENMSQREKFLEITFGLLNGTISRMKSLSMNYYLGTWLYFTIVRYERFDMQLAI